MAQVSEIKLNVFGLRFANVVIDRDQEVVPIVTELSYVSIKLGLLVIVIKNRSPLAPVPEVQILTPFLYKVPDQIRDIVLLNPLVIPVIVIIFDV